MNLRIVFLVAWLGVFSFASAQEQTVDSWSFFSKEDRQQLVQSAKSPWGEPIVAALRAIVEERLTHAMVVPEREAGHFHHYFCPEHKRILEFRWESPNAHLCPDGEHTLTGDAYDNAWIGMVHGRNRQFLHTCALLHVITGERRFAEYIRWMLLEYAARYPEYRLHGHDMRPAIYGGRMLCQTLDESVWAADVAPAFVEALTIFSAAETRTVRDRLFRPMAETIYANRAGGNWQVWHNAGLAALAVALEDPHWLSIALDDPEHGYHAMLDKGVTREGFWDERSPGYHFYPLQAMLKTAEAVRCRGIDLYDARLRAMCTGPVQCVYPDLSFPAHNDGWHGVSLVNQAPLYELAALRFSDSFLQQVVAKAYARGARRDWAALLRNEEIIPDPSPLQLESCVLEDTGVAFLRHAGRTVVLKFGPYGGGHGHPDKLSITIHDGTREIVPDLGTTGYGVPDHVAWYRKTLAHSTVVVDRADQQPVAGTLVTFATAEDGATVTAECHQAYAGVVLRRTLELRGAILEDTFTAASEIEHDYDYVLILADPVTPAPTAIQATLPDLGGYERIRNAVTWSAHDRAFLTVGRVSLVISGPESFQLTTGQAPGVPGSFQLHSSMKPCYPLLVSVHAPSLKVKATWTFEEEADAHR